MNDATAFVRRWLRHAALNLGFALSSLVFMLVPPQWHHSREECEGFDQKGAWRWFRDGLGF